MGKPTQALAHLEAEQEAQCEHRAKEPTQPSLFDEGDLYALDRIDELRALAPNKESFRREWRYV